jgi:multidrug efflux pump subunit AcrA (membrane-fusion protein)
MANDIKDKDTMPEAPAPAETPAETTANAEPLAGANMDEGPVVSGVSAEALAAQERREKTAKAKKKLRRKKTIRRIIIIILILLVIGAIAFGIMKLFKEEEVQQEILTDFVRTGSIQSMVTGSGVTQPKESKTITLSAGGTVLDVYVTEGQWVEEGEPLYVIDSSEAEEAVKNAETSVTDYQKQINNLTKSLEDLTVTAPFSGKLIDVADIEKGDDIGMGMKIATVVDDSQMKLKLYFSYAYKDAIYVGQSAAVTVPSAMSQLSGRVSEISYVDYVSPEGGSFFEVVILADNPGALSSGTAASAQITAGDGSVMYPYDSAKLEYSKTSELTAKISGEVLAANLKDYKRVSSGELLLKISEDDSESTLATLRTNLRKAEETLESAKERLDAFHATAPISGKVISCSLTPGETVNSGTAVISIADTTEMTVEAQIDEMNISYVKPGMMCSITQYGMDGDNFYTGTVESVSLEGKFANGVSYFPAIIKVDNPGGNMMSGMYVDYSLVASQSDNCLIVPVQAVKYTVSGTVVFVRAEAAPAETLDAEALGIEIPEGFVPVAVTTGLSDDSGVEITSGLEDGMEVFVQYITANASSYGW